MKKMDLLNESDFIAKNEGIDIEKEVLEKNDTVGKTIIEYAKKSKMDVIAIGTKGMTAVEKYFLEVWSKMCFNMLIIQCLRSVELL